MANEKSKKKSSKSKSSKEESWNIEIKEMLLEMKKDILKGVLESVKTESDHLRFDVGDFYDHASSDRDRELALTLADRERQKLVMIDDALKRIEEGGYGICGECGDEIDIERLRAMPFARYCLSCQEDLERQ